MHHAPPQPPQVCGRLNPGARRYVGVQALHGQEAEYSLNATLVEPPPEDGSYKCDRWNAPCPAPFWLADDRPEGLGVRDEYTSAAPRRWGAQRGVLVGAAAPIFVAAAVVWRPERRRPRSE
eukprot:1659358-Prymnesium_polylepis.1